jgi:hypothetical protein
MVDWLTVDHSTEGDRSARHERRQVTDTAGRSMVFIDSIERAAPRCLTLATVLVQEAHGPVADWEKDHSVDVALLRHALDELAAVEALTPPMSHFYRREYRAVDESLKIAYTRVPARSSDDFFTPLPLGG